MTTISQQENSNTAEGDNEEESIRKSATTTMTTISQQEHSNTADSDNEQECIVCWETLIPNNNKATAIPNNKEAIASACTTETLPCCRHAACQNCMKSWIERYEQEGKDHVTCPYCRQKFNDEFLKKILGRSYDNVNQRKQRPDDEEVPVDDFTQTWFEENDAYQCTNCGMWMIQEDDGDDTPTACVCGFIYCWGCREDAQECDCSPCEFYDPMVGEVFSMDVASRFPVAGPEDFNDMSSFVEERKAAIYRYQEGDDSDEEEEDSPKIVEEPIEGEELLLVPLFADCCCGKFEGEESTSPTEGVVIPAA